VRHRKVLIVSLFSAAIRGCEKEIEMLRLKVVTAALICLTGTIAAAETISIGLQAGINPVSVGPNFKYSYDVTASVNTLQVGDYFVLYDFAGFTGVGDVTTTGLLSTDFTLSTTLNGPTPFAQSYVDSNSIPDLVFTYNGATQAPAGSPINDILLLSLGSFSANSSFGTTTKLTYSAQDHANALIDPARGQQGNTGLVLGPTAVPLPATANTGLALFGGLGVVGVWRRLKSVKLAV